MSFIQRLLGSESQSEEEAEQHRDEEPSHVCQSCGEEYYSRWDGDVDTCRECGGVKVERV